MSKFLFYIFIDFASFSAIADDEVLYWMVDDTAVVHYNDGRDVSMPYMVPEAVDTTLAARVRVVGGGLTEDVFLNVAWDVDGQVEYWTTEWGIDFGDPGGHWGCGTPTGNQSPLTGGMASVQVGSPEYSFIIEIGNYDWNEDSWTTVASSRAYTHSELLTSSYIHDTFDISPSNLEVWNPHDYYAAVPEPSAGILFLIGSSLLVLRRKIS